MAAACSLILALKIKPTKDMKLGRTCQFVGVIVFYFKKVEFISNFSFIAANRIFK